MKLRARLLFFALSLSSAGADEYLNLFDDGEVVSQGTNLIAPPELSSTGQILTVNGDRAHRWDENTGDLISTEEGDTLDQPLYDPLVVDSATANLLAYVDPNDELVLLQRDSGTILGIHNFDGEYSEREVVELKLLPKNRLLSVYTEPKQPPCNTPFCGRAFSSRYDLIDTETGQIVRTFSPGGRTIYKYLSPPGSDVVLVIDSADPFPGYIPIPGREFSPNSTLIHGLYFIDPTNGADLLSPLATPDNRSFRGSLTFDKSSENLYAILEPNQLTKLHLPTLEISKVEIQLAASASQMRIVGDTLFALLLKPDHASPSYSLASWQTDTLNAQPTIESVSENPSGIYEYIPIHNGDQAIVRDRFGAIELWDTLNGEFIRTVKTLSSEQTILQWTASPDSRKLYAHVLERIYPNPDTHISYVWRVEDGATLVNIPHEPEIALPPPSQFTPDSQKILLYTASDETTAVLLSTGQTAFTLPHSKAVATGYYANGSRRLVVHANGLLEKLSATGTVTTFQLPFDTIQPYQINQQDGRFLFGSSNRIRTYNPNTDAIATIWNTENTGLPNRASLDSDSNRLHLFWQVYDNSDVETPSRSLIVDLVTHATLADIKTAPISALAHSNDNRRFAYSTIIPTQASNPRDPYNEQQPGPSSGSNDIRIHDLTTGQLVATIAWDAKVETLAFTPDNKELIVLSKSELARIDSESGAILHSRPFAFSSSRNSIDSYRSKVSSDGRLLSLAGFSGDLRLFNLPTLQPINKLTPGLAHALYNHGFTIALAPDSTSFLSIDFLGNVRQWALRPGRSIAAKIETGNGKLYLSTTSQPGRIYETLRSSDLRTWTKGPPIPSTEAPTSTYLGAPAETQFYRIIEYPPLEEN